MLDTVLRATVALNTMRNDGLAMTPPDLYRRRVRQWQWTLRS
jgi:hypothetical protein